MAPAMPTADPSYPAAEDPATVAPANDATAVVDTTAPAIPPTDVNPEPAMQPAYGGYDETAAQSASAPTSDTGNDDSTPVDHQDLMAIKNEALQHLSPMVGSLEQSAEEKFKTLMMMIQASDDHTKLKEAFEVAKLIEDDKARAQALLDVINEINYFTQPATA